MLSPKIQELMDDARKAYLEFEFKQSFEKYMEALKEQNKESVQLQDKMAWAKIYTGIIDALNMDGDWLKALEYAGILISEARIRKNEKVEVEARLMASRILLNHGNWEEAEKKYKGALKLAEKSGTNQDVGHCYYGIAYIDWRKGDMTSAKFKANKALALLKGDGQELHETKATILKASIEDAMGNTEASIDLFKKALSKLESLDENEELARAHNNLGEVYKGIEDYESASKHYEACIDVSRKVKSKRGELYGLSNTAECYAFLKKTREAMELVAMVEKQLKTTHEKYIMAQIRYIKGIIHNADGDNDAAIDEYRVAIDKLMKMGAPPYDLGLAYFRLGQAYLALKDKNEARQALERSERYFKKVDSKLYLQKVRALLD